ncbi:hypothetical protein V2J09_007360 [Rumex salicifolius]
MVPSGPSTPMGNPQSVPPSLLRSNSNIMGGQGGQMPSQGGFPSLLSPRTQYNNVNLLGNVSNVSSVLNQSFGNGVVGPGLSGGSSGGQRGGGMDSGAEPDPLSGMGFMQTHMTNPVSSSGQGQQQFMNHSGNNNNNNQMMTDQQHSNSQQLDQQQSFQHPQQQQLHQQHQQQPMQQQFQSIRGGLGGVGQVKLESQVNNNSNNNIDQQQQLQSLRGIGGVKMESQQLQSMRSLPPVKMEPQHSDQSMFLHQQQQQHQQQQLLHMSRQSPQAAAAVQLFQQQQRLLQMQQHQQQQQQQQRHLLNTIPQQNRTQIQQHIQAQNLQMRPPVKPGYEVGMCARRVTQYMSQQQNRPEDNSIEFWRKFVDDFFAPNAKKKWCVSMYGNGRQTTGVFPQASCSSFDAWHCEICNRKPGRGFEATVEVLPRLFKIKYESGTMEELLYVDMPREYHNPSGQIVLDYSKAIQESVFEQLRVVRDGHLRIVFSQDLKICSWEFCARRHEELIPRRLLIPQVSQLGNAAQKYQAATQNSSSNLSVADLQGTCNMFVASARQVAKALEVPLVNDLGYTKRYVRCLQISEVVNSMKDLIDYSRVTGTGPMESLAKYPRRTNTSSGFQGQSQQLEDQQRQPGTQQQQLALQNSNNEQNLSSGQATPSTTAQATANPMAGLLHQNSMNSRPQNHQQQLNNNAGSPYAMASPTSSSSMQPPPPVQQQQNASPFHSPTPSSNALQQHDGDQSDSQSSVQKIIQEMMISGQLNGRGGVMMGVNDMKNVNGLLSGSNGPNNLMGSGSGMGMGTGYGGGISQAAMMNGVRAAMGNNNNPMAMNGRVAMANMARDQHQHQQLQLQHQHQHQHQQQQQQQQQQDPGNQLLSGLGSVNGFNNSLQFDWKPSP